MNLVAHQILSFNNSNFKLGNFLGEVVRGKAYQDFSSEVSKGILLHRFIDSFTDNHTLVKELTQIFHHTQGKYSPIIIDIVFDYFLIQHWQKFSDEDFETFTQNTYILVQKNWSLFPEKLQFMLRTMLDENWFVNYKTLQGINESLLGVSKIAKFNNNLQNALPLIESNYNKIEDNFLTFFPEIYQQSQSFIAK